MIEGSREVIDLKFGFGDPAFLHHQLDTADKLGKSREQNVARLLWDINASHFFFTVGFVFLVSGVNLESGDAQEIGITYEMMQVCEGSLCFKSCLQVVKKMKVFENFFFFFFGPNPFNFYENSEGLIKGR